MDRDCEIRIMLPIIELCFVEIHDLRKRWVEASVSFESLEDEAPVTTSYSCSFFITIVGESYRGL
jgi:hypothetical protein